MVLIWKKKDYFWPTFHIFLVTGEKTQKFLQHMSCLYTYTYFAQPIDFFFFFLIFDLPILQKLLIYHVCCFFFSVTPGIDSFSHHFRAQGRIHVWSESSPPPFWQINHANSAYFRLFLGYFRVITGTRPPLLDLGPPFYISWIGPWSNKKKITKWWTKFRLECLLILIYTSAKFIVICIFEWQ